MAWPRQPCHAHDGNTCWDQLLLNKQHTASYLCMLTVGYSKPYASYAQQVLSICRTMCAHRRYNARAAWLIMYKLAVAQLPQRIQISCQGVSKHMLLNK
jgi:hypothetical protein